VNICHVITRLIIGGAQENTILTCRGLAEAGHRVTLIAGPETGSEGSLWDSARSIGCDVISLSSLRRSVNPWNDWRARNALVRCFHRISPDVVHTHSSKAGILGRWAAHRAGVPVIVHTIHGMSFNRTQGRFTQALYRFLEKRCARYTTRFVSVADAMTREAVAAGLASMDRFVTVRSGMEVDRFTPSSEAREAVRRGWGVASDEIVVGTVARLFQDKGYEEIIAAMRIACGRSVHLRFAWVGGGPHRARYEEQLQRLGLRDRVILLGLVPPDEIPAILGGFDILLHASRWEGLPRAVVQGLLMEVPAVTFDNDGAPEVVRNGETGELVPYGDTNGLAEALVRLAEREGLRRELGRNGRNLCVSEFDHRRMVGRLEELYRRPSERS